MGEQPELKDPWDQFLGLNCPASDRDDEFVTFPLGPDTRFRVGKDWQSNPALLIEEEDESPQQPAVLLQNLELRYCLTCKTNVDAGEPVIETLTVLRCLSESDSLHRDFVEFAAVLVAGYHDDLARGSATEVIDRLVRLLTAAASPSREKIEGLWGELLLIADSTEPHKAIGSWRFENNERFDFATEEARCEVKTTAAGKRVHDVRHNQLTAPGPPTVLASVQTVVQDGGTSCRDLIHEILNRPEVSADLGSRLLEVVGQTVGSDSPLLDTARFDRGMASEGLKLIATGDLPLPGPDFPAEISRLRYDLDVGAVEQSESVTLVPLLEALGLIQGSP